MRADPETACLHIAAACVVHITAKMLDEPDLEVMMLMMKWT